MMNFVRFAVCMSLVFLIKTGSVSAQNLIFAGLNSNWVAAAPPNWVDDFGASATWVNGSNGSFEDNVPSFPPASLPNGIAITVSGIINTNNLTISNTGSAYSFSGSNINVNGALSVSATNGVVFNNILNVTGNTSVSTSITFDRSVDTTFAGNIIGVGSVSKNGVGTLIFTGNNTYIGGTTVNAASLQIGNGGAAGSITSNVNLAGASTNLTFNRSDSLSYGGAVSGSGSLTKNGAGALTLSGNNSYGGVTTVNNGSLILTGTNTGTGNINVNTGTSLQIGTGGTVGSIAANVVLASGTNVNFNRSNTYNYGGVVSGTGGTLTKSGAGTLVLAGTNTYTGATTVNGGTLQIGDGTTNGSIAGSSGIVLTSGTVDFNRSDAQTYGGAISGGGALTKSGSNVLTLTGNNGYSGTTTINQGTLQVNGTHTGGGIYNVSSGATLAGTGSIAASSVNVAAGANLGPGNSPGTLAIVGNLDLNGNYLWEANGNAADLTTVTGNIDLTGSTLNASFAGLLANKYTLFAYNGTLTGIFASTNLNPLNWLINYNDGAPGVNGAGGFTSFITITAVPEPSSLALLGLTSLGLIGFRRRRA
jgi:autotransporter-associated beta strand protein